MLTTNKDTNKETNDNSISKEEYKKRNDLIFSLINVPTNIVSSTNIQSLGLNIVQNFKNSNKSIFILLPSLYECQNLYNIITEYIDKEKISLFINDEVLRTNTLTQSKEFDIECVNTLYKLLTSKQTKEKQIIISNITGYLTLLANKETFQERILTIKKGMQITRNTIEKMLQTSSYSKVRDVFATSEYSTRGMIIDIFSPNYDTPFRIELFDDEVEDIRFFDTKTEMSYKSVDEVTIIPCTFRLLNQKQKNGGLTLLKEKTSSKNMNNSFIKDDFFLLLEENCQDLYLNANLSRYFPYFLEKQSNIIDYINTDDFDLYLYDKEKIIDQIYYFYKEEYEIFNNENEVKSLDKDGIFISNEESLILLDKLNIINSEIDTSCNIVPPTIVSRGIDETIGMINSYKIQNINCFIFLSEYQKENIRNYFNINKFKYIEINNLNELNNVLKEYETNKDSNKENIVALVSCPLSNSFLDLTRKNVILTSFDIYGRGIKKSSFLSRFKQSKVIKKYDDLEFGDYVVHEKYGIGQYLGVQVIDKLEYLKIQYANNQKLYIPLNQFRYIRKYASRDGYVPTLDTMDGSSWQRRKAKIRNKVSFMADQLLSLYAQRVSTPGFSFQVDEELEKEFQTKFPFKLTSSQLNACEEIKKDMEKPYPMDRIIIGDVGFGKTELAFQAAYRAIVNNKQVCFLCPTTILSKQHYEVALNRFAGTGVVIKLVNRYISNKEMKQIIIGLKQHKIDMVIGTHKLLSNNLVFSSLGLLIVDEEQRFGVTHKEKIKAISTNVDCLTLSATPIPRTLQMSLVNLKNISTLSDPPENRIPIRTYVCQKDNNLIKEAIQRELGRKGQVYYLFNDVSRMFEVCERLRKMFPSATIEMAHGQMDGDKLDSIMTSFYNDEIDILVCTTIIESGLDVQNANTIIVEKCNNFGLSQLYQIKGRVGRFDKMAYCYLLYDNYNTITEDARKRLVAMKSFVELGSGYKIASTDLKIRGAGDILGKIQSGHIDSIGYESFNKLVKEVIEKQREQRGDISSYSTDKTSLYSTLYNEKGNNYLLSFSLDAKFPDDYCTMEDRISLYRELSNIDTLEELTTFTVKLKDVYGSYSNEVNNLLNKRKIEIILNMGFVESFQETLVGYKIVINEKITFLKEGYKELLNNLSVLVDYLRMMPSSRTLTLYLNRTNEYLENLLFITTQILEIYNKYNNIPNETNPNLIKNENDKLIDNVD